MSFEKYEHGPLLDFEVTWTNGHVERVQAHQVLDETNSVGIFGPSATEPRIKMHGEFDGHWQVVLVAPASEIKMIRNLTRTEVL
jgi:hypothetical protein